MNIFTLVGKIVLDSGAAEKDLAQLKKQAEGAGAGFDDLKKDADDTGDKLDQVSKDAKTAGDAIDDAGDKAKKAGDKFDDAGKRGGSAIGGLAKGLGDVAKIAGGFIVADGISKLGGFLISAAQGAAEDAAATDRLNQSLGNYVERSGIAQKGTEDYAYALEELQTDVNARIESGAKLAFSDDDVRDSLQSLLNATDDYGEATNRQAAAMDLARGANIPLATATRLLGKINAENVDVFKRMGIELAENATEADALAAVQARYGGQAEAYAKSTAGQFEQAKIRMAELKEGIGAALLPAITALMGFVISTVIPGMEKFTAVLSAVFGGVVSEAVANVKSFIAVLSGSGGYGESIAEAEGNTGKIRKAVADFALFIRNDVIPAIQAVIAVVQENWPTIEKVIAFGVDFVITKIEGMIQIIRGIVDVVTGVIDLIDALIHGRWSDAWTAFEQIVSGVLDIMLGSIKYIFGNIPEVVLGLLGEAKDAAAKFAQSMFDAIVSILEKLPGKMRELGRDAANSFLDSISIMGVSAGDAAHVVGKLVSGFMDDGGIVPGRVGSPQLILAHGGETIIPTHKMSVGAYFQEGSDWASHASVSRVSTADRSMSSEGAAFMPGGAGVDMKLYNATIYATDLNDAKRSFDDLGVGWAYKLNKEGASLP